MTDERYFGKTIESLQDAIDNLLAAAEAQSALFDTQREYIEYLEGKLMLYEKFSPSPTDIQENLSIKPRKDEK